MDSPVVVGAVLTGGASRRMGRPKAVEPLDGAPMGAWVIDALRAGGALDVVAVGGDREWGTALGVAVVSDRWPGEGPLGAMATALADAPDAVGRPDASTVVVAACDQPSLDATTIAALVAASGAHGIVAATRTPDGRRHPFPSAWPVQLANPLAQLVRDGYRRADAAWSLGPVHDIDVAADRIADVDRPADLRGLEPGSRRLADARTDAHQESPVNVPEIDINEAAARRAEGVPLIDVREPEEYREAHAPGARLIPLGTVPERISEVPSQGPVLIICKSGGRSMSAAEMLRSAGIDAINVAGGTMAWIEAGHHVVTGDAPDAGA